MWFYIWDVYSWIQCCYRFSTKDTRQQLSSSYIDLGSVIEGTPIQDLLTCTSCSSAHWGRINQTDIHVCCSHGCYLGLKSPLCSFIVSYHSNVQQRRLKACNRDLSFQNKRCLLFSLL